MLCVEMFVAGECSNFVVYVDFILGVDFTKLIQNVPKGEMGKGPGGGGVGGSTLQV